MPYYSILNGVSHRSFMDWWFPASPARQPSDLWRPALVRHWRTASFIDMDSEEGFLSLMFQCEESFFLLNGKLVRLFNQFTK